MNAPDTLPPHDPESERAALGAVLLNPAALAEVVEIAPPGDFYLPAHCEILDAALRVAAKGDQPDTITVAGELLGSGALIRLGGAPYLHTLISSVPTAANAAYYAERVRDTATRRRLIEVGVRIAQLGRVEGQPPDELVQRAADALSAVQSGPTRAGTGRTLRATPASAVVARRLRWTWDGRIVAGGLTLLAGREGLGKSTISVDIAAQLTRGQLVGEHKGEPRSVIYVNSEDARDFTIVPRLVAAGADLDRVIFLDAITPHPDGDVESPLVLPLDDELLVDAIRQHEASLVVLDAATSVIDGRLDGDKDRQMRQGLERIARIGEVTDAAMLGLVHFGKRDTGDTGKLILGSIAWSQVARSVLALARDDSADALVLSATKANLAPGDATSLAVQIVPATVQTTDGPTSVGRVEWLGDTDQRAQDLLSAMSDPEERSALDEAVDWLRSYFADPDRGGAESASTVLRAAKADGISERTLQRARKTAGVTTGRSVSGWTWSLDPSGATQGAKASTC